jgi:flagellar M-ring protein FliF
MPDPFNRLSSLFNGLGLSRKITLVLAGGGTMAGLIFLAALSHAPEYQTLFSGLNQEDASSIVARLKELRIPYRIEGNGSIITVPSEKVYETRLTLAGEGMPQGGGVGFEIFDKSGFGVTEFVQKVNYRRALQGELSRTIMQLAEVESARVHIVIPEKSLFTENQERGKVSVVLRLRPGKGLAKRQIDGIVHLASSSVEGIAPSDVTVVDNHGQMLSGANDNATARLSNSNIEYQKMLEKDMESGIQSMLEKVVGVNKAIARVSAVIDFKQVEKTEERYDPDGVVVRSEQRVQERSTGAATASAGVPGVASNLPGGREELSADEGQAPSSQRQNETINYEVSKVVSRVVEPVGTVQKLTVAVLVDGNYGPAGKDGNREYTPRSEEEMQKIAAIVRNAVGFNEERGDRVEVVNIPFGGEDVQEEAPAAPVSVMERYPWLPMAAMRYLVPLLIAMTAIIFVLRPLVKWAIRGGTSAAPGTAQLPLPVTIGELQEASGAALPEVGLQESLMLRQKAVELVKSKPRESAHVIKSWLKEK